MQEEGGERGQEGTQPPVFPSPSLPGIPPLKPASLSNLFCSCVGPGDHATGVLDPTFPSHS